MFVQNNSEYYRRRAEQAQALAAAATMPDVQAIHRDMASRYAALAEETGPPVRPTLRLGY